MFHGSCRPAFPLSAFYFLLSAFFFVLSAFFFVPGSGSQVSFGLTWSFVTQLMPGKQQGRRFPFASMSQAFSIRRSRVSACFAELTQRIHSRRAVGVTSAPKARASAAAALIPA